MPGNRRKYANLNAPAQSIVVVDYGIVELIRCILNLKISCVTQISKIVQEFNSFNCMTLNVRVFFNILNNTNKHIPNH